MFVEPIASVAAQQLSTVLPPHDGPAPPQSINGSGGVPFSQLIARGLDNVNDQLRVGQADLQALATGEAQNLHEVMIRMEETRINFQLLMQVRGRLLEAYQDVMKMQV